MLRNIICVTILFAANLLVFGQVVGFDVSSWDDKNLIYHNPTYFPVRAESFKIIWTTQLDGMYNPLTRSLWALEAWLGTHRDANGQIALDSRIFHAGNLLLHLANAVLTFLVLKQLVEDDWAALFGALLYSLHPLQVEAVAWISEAKGLLCGFFSLISIWQYLAFRAAKGMTNHAASRRVNAHYTLAVVAFILASLSKSASVTLPLVILILDRFWLRNDWRSVAIRVGPWFGLSLVGAIAQKLLQPDQMLEVYVPVWLRPLVMLDGWFFYLVKLFVPLGLFPFYDHAADTVAYSPVSWLWAGLFLAIVVALFWLPHARVWLVGLAIVVAFTLPYSGLLLHAIQRISTVQDRYMYLAMLGPSFCFAWCIAHFLKSSEKKSRVIVIGSAILVLFLGGTSFAQARIWRSDKALFTYSVEQNPRSATALRWLAYTHELEDRYETAEVLLRRALEYDSDWFEIYYNLGICVQRQGKVDEAIRAYEEAIRLKPDLMQARQNLAVAYLAKSRKRDAAAQLQYLVDANSKLMWVHEMLGTMLLDLSDFPDAEQHYRQALKIYPRWAAGYANLSIAFAEQGKLDDAELALRAAIDLDPKNESLQRNLQQLTKLRESK